MTDIPLNSNVQLNQVLTQLVKAAPNSDIARQAIEVVVRQLEGNQLSLDPATNAQLKTALLPSSALQGTLNTGQTYQIKLNSEPSNLLQFFSKTELSELSKLPLTEQLTQVLLRLPANQLSQLFNQNKLNFLTETSTKNANLFAVLKGVVTNISDLDHANKQTSINIDITKSGPLLSIPLSAATTFQKGDLVNLEMISKGKNWQLNIVALSKTSQTPNTTVDKVSISNQTSATQSNVKDLKAETAILRGEKAQTYSASSQSQNFAPAIIKVTLTPLQASELVKTVLQQQSSKQNIEINLPLKSVITQLTQSNTFDSNALLQKVLNVVPEKLTLQIKSSGDATLLLQHPKLIATLPISNANLESLVPLKIINKEQVRANLAKTSELINPSQIRSLNEPLVKSSTLAITDNQVVKSNSLVQVNPLVKTLNDGVKSDVVVNNSRLIFTPVVESSKLATSSAVSDVVAQTKPDINARNPETLPAIKPAKEISVYPSTLPEFNHKIENLEVKGKVESVISSEFIANKPAQVALLQSLLRLSQPKAELTSTVLTAIEKILSEPVSVKTLTELTTQSWVKQIVQEVRQAVPQGNEQDASHIKQLLSTPAISLSAVQMVNPPASQGLLSGLITLLQVSLASRFLRNQPSQAERLAQILPSIFNESGKGETAANPTKAMQEFSQLEQKGQLIREIGRLLAEHQSNKLSNAEKLLQGQETYYYNLPSLMGDKFNNVELLIKREEQNKEETQQNANSPKTWQLTMKLSVGELGEILTKARLRPDHVEIDFYASNEQVKHQVMNFMPLLKRRLTSLGIEVTKAQCQLGKIPQTLAERPYHFFMAKA
jgi:hypothetical protein